MITKVKTTKKTATKGSPPVDLDDIVRAEGEFPEQKAARGKSAAESKVIIGNILVGLAGPWGGYLAGEIPLAAAIGMSVMALLNMGLRPFTEKKLTSVIPE